MLYLCGQDDMNVPLLNTEQLYQAVRRINKVPTELVIYPGENHVPRRPGSIKDVYQRYIAWYDRFLKPAGAVPPEAAAAGATPEALCSVAICFLPLRGRCEKPPPARLAGTRRASDADNAETPLLQLGRWPAPPLRGHRTFTHDGEFENDARFHRHRGHHDITARQPKGMG